MTARVSQRPVCGRPEGRHYLRMKPNGPHHEALGHYATKSPEFLIAMVKVAEYRKSTEDLFRAGLLHWSNGPRITTAGTAALTVLDGGATFEADCGVAA